MAYRVRVRVAVALVALAPAVLLGQPASSPAPVFTAQELIDTVKTLAAPDMEGRRAGTPGNARAREWIVRQFTSAALEPFGGSYEQPFQFTPRPQGDQTPPEMTGVNVAGLCRGTGAKDGGVIVVTAHYDHLGVRDGATYYGADDNASGVAGLLALARQCRQTPWSHDTIFVAFDAEEMGLRGARAFVESPPVPKERIAINVNLDMVARGDKGEIYIAGTHHTPALRAIVEPVAAAAAIKVLLGHDSGGGQDDWTTQSDHGAFHQAKTPFLYFGVEDHPDYHKPTDTADKINPDFLYQAVVTVMRTISAIDRALPLQR